MLVPIVERNDAVARITRTGVDTAELTVFTFGRTIAPLPWDGLHEPITVRVMAAWSVAPDEADREMVARSWQLHAALVHTIRHNMGTRDMIESIRSGDEAIFAGFTILDENRVRIELTEAVPITVSILFLT